MSEYSYRSFELHPEGTFRAQIIGGEDREGQHGPCKLWQMRTTVVQEDGHRAEIRYLTGVQFSANAKITKLVRACGLAPPEDAETARQFNDDILIGRILRIVVAHEDIKGTRRDVIAAVYPDTKAAPGPEPEPEPEPLDDEDPFADGA